MGSFGMMLLGVLFLPLLGAGILVILLGIWMYWFGARNIKIVEAAFSEYLAIPPARRYRHFCRMQPRDGCCVDSIAHPGTGHHAECRL